MRNWSTAEAVKFLERSLDADSPPNEPRGTAFLAAVRRWHEVGLKPGDLVLIALPNGIDLLDHWFGVLHAGGVPALLPPCPSGRLAELAEVLMPRAVLASASAGRLPFAK